jgi:hypothetical protein
MKTRSYLGTSGILWLLIIGLILSACGTQGSPTVQEAPRLEQAALPSGSLVSWGDNNFGQVSHTPTGTGFVAVAGGFVNSVALRSDGSLVSWGHNNYGQVSHTPTGTGFVAVAAGGYHNVALRSDGSLVSWGSNDYGQVSNTPTGTGFVAVAAGGYHSVALKASPCPAGQYNDGTGCVNADPGHYVDTSGATAQTPCPAGFYQPNSGATSCLAAAAGNFVATEGATAQTPCAVGTYQTNSGADSCLQALPGYYVPTTGATAQTLCPSGTTSVAGASACTPISPSFTFSGFFAPVDNPPVVNVVKAGQAIPVKFSLGGNQDLAIFASGSPSSQQVACDSSAPQDTVTETVTAGSSSLSYDTATDTYSYVWKTDKSWANSCRTLTLAFSDGTTKTANFRLSESQNHTPMGGAVAVMEER